MHIQIRRFGVLILPATCNIDNFALDIIGLFIHQKTDRMSHIACKPRTIERNMRDNIFQFFLHDMAIHFRIDESRTYCIYRDAARPDFFCQSFYKTVLRSFDGRVNDLIACPDISPDGGDKYDFPRTLLDHAREEMLSDQPRRLNMEREHLIHLLFRNVLEQSKMRGAAYINDSMNRA